MKRMVRKGNAPGQIDLTAYFERSEVEIEADLSDWHAVQRELWGRSRPHG